MKKNQRKLRWQYFIIIPAIIIALSAGLFLGYQAVNASLGKGQPVVGSRFNNDLDPAISQDSITKITEDLKAMNGVKDAKIVLKSATLRVYIEIDTNRDANITANLQNAYDIVTKELKVEDYFSIKGLQKNYDLEIHGYNQVPSEDNKGYIYGVLVKGSNMLEPSTQILTKPQSQDVVDYFYEEEKRKDELQNNPPVVEEEETTTE
jgi:hypothetical protein